MTEPFYRPIIQARKLFLARFFPFKESLGQQTKIKILKVKRVFNLRASNIFLQKPPEKALLKLQGKGSKSISKICNHNPVNRTKLPFE